MEMRLVSGSASFSALGLGADAGYGGCTLPTRTGPKACTAVEDGSDNENSTQKKKQDSCANDKDEEQISKEGN